MTSKRSWKKAFAATQKGQQSTESKPTESKTSKPAADLHPEVKKSSGNTQSVYHAPAAPCHYGNTLIGQIGPGRLWAGGWTRGANPANKIVIDLTGSHPFGLNGIGFSHAMSAGKSEILPYLSFPIQDFSVPTVDANFWNALVRDMAGYLTAGKDILIACTGGHGRTGMVVAIVATLLGICKEDDPVAWIRKVHCDEAVETPQQEAYVFTALGREVPEVYKSHVSKGYGSWFGYGEETCVLCGCFLDKKWGDDMVYKICAPCLKDPRKATSVKAVRGHSEDDIAVTKVEQPKKEEHPDPDTVGDAPDACAEDLGYCIFCGAPLEPGDFIDKEVCQSCKAYLDGEGIPTW